jgi:enterochelin esterase-like enzyme
VRFAPTLVLWVLAVVPAHLGAQDRLTVNKPVLGEPTAGGTAAYFIDLGAGDYVTGAITQQGQASISIYLPGGEVLRRFPAPSADGTRQFAFVSETAGSYRIEVTSPANRPARFELLVEQVISVEERLRTDVGDLYPSPRIGNLRRQVASGQVNTDAFWKQVAAEGAPLVEPFGKDGQYQLVTFLWRGGDETHNVLVLGSVQGPRSDLENVLRRIPNSDVWYLTLRLQAGARFTYQLSHNDPLVSDGRRRLERDATLQADPLNPVRTLCVPGSSKYACSSAVELPGAVPQPWIVAKTGTPEGRIETFQVRSDIEKVERSVAIYTPPTYRPDGPPNALLVLFDGPTYLDSEVRAPITLNNLIAASRIPPTVAVFVSNVAGRRVQDLSPESDFANFIAKELVPWVRARYNVTMDPKQAIVGGYSLGGLTAAYAGLRYSDVFGNVLTQSGSFWWAPEGTDATVEYNWMAKEFIASPKLPVRF